MQDNKYLKHDASASMGYKLMSLSEKEGLKGYGAYWLLLEMLRKAEGFRAPMAVLMVLARRVRVKSLFLRRVVEDYDLFIIEDGYFYSPGLCKRLANYVQKVAKVSVNDSFNHLIINDLIPISAREVEVKVKEKNNSNSNNKVAAASASAAASPSVLDRGWGEGVGVSALPVALPWEELVGQMAACQEWMDLTGLHSQLGELYVAHRPQVVELFKNHIRRRDKGGQLLTLHDVKEYFANCLTPGTWTCQAMREQLLLHHNRCLQAQQGSLYETLVEGKRTYLGRPIPDDAPPRPDPYSVWDEETKLWRR